MSQLHHQLHHLHAELHCDAEWRRTTRLQPQLLQQGHQLLEAAEEFEAAAAARQLPASTATACCMTCGEPGHLRRDCPKLHTAQGTSAHACATSSRPSYSAARNKCAAVPPPAACAATPDEAVEAMEQELDAAGV
jgi:hypothetical protein